MEVFYLVIDDSIFNQVLMKMVTNFLIEFLEFKPHYRFFGWCASQKVEIYVFLSNELRLQPMSSVIMPLTWLSKVILSTTNYSN